MKRFTFILLTMIYITLTSSLKADELKQSLNNELPLPSAQTQNRLDELAPGKIETRQAPDEDGWAQKETPLSEMSMSVISLIAAASLGYALVKKTNRQNMQK